MISAIDTKDKTVHDNAVKANCKGITSFTEALTPNIKFGKAIILIAIFVFIFK